MTAFRSPINLNLTKTPIVPNEEYEALFTQIWNALRALQLAIGDTSGLAYSTDPTYFHEQQPNFAQSIQVHNLLLIRVTANVNIAAGQIVNLFDNGAVLAARLAVASGISTRAHGWAMETITAGNPIMIALDRGYKAVVGATRGVTYYLSDITPGGISAAVPVGSGKIIQEVGLGLSATYLFVRISSPNIIP